MAQLSDKTRAERRLQARERDGYTLLEFWRTNRQAYLLTFLCYGIPLLASALTHFWTVFGTLAGLLVGTLLRDRDWIRQIKRDRAFTEKIIDWEKVQQTASDAPIADPSKA
jgi:hypothetical protein